MSRGKKQQNQKQDAAKKQKLRTAAEVINRLRWDPLKDSENDGELLSVLLGYDDRVNGPMEKSLDDFVPIQEGGDIPEHRLWYVRVAARNDDDDDDDESDSDDASGSNENLDPSAKLSDVEIQDLVLWDRPGRVDKLFANSGEQNKSISKETISNVRSAMQNMARLEAEKIEKKRLRDKERQRKAQRQKAKQEAIALLGSKTTQKQNPKSALERYTWDTTNHFEFSREKNAWIPQACAPKKGVQKSTEDHYDFKIVSWNVLFDLYTEKGGEDDTNRWKTIVRELEQTQATVIALQEVTPRFLDILCTSELMQNEYAMTAAPSFFSTVSPYGNLLLWRKNELLPLSTFVCRDGSKHRSSLAVLDCQANGDTLMVANVHLLADKEGNSAALARRRELCSVLGQMQMLESKLGHGVVPMIVGDFNSENELEDGCFAGEGLVGNQVREGLFSDAWALLPKADQGYTFDPQTNPRAAFTQEETTKAFQPKRIDRLYISRQRQRHTIENEKHRVSLKPSDGALLGTSPTNDVPPSDHFGLSIALRLFRQNRKLPSLQQPSTLGKDAWAASIESSTDTLLGIVLGDKEIGGVQVFDEQSSLPIPHVTLLHGFASVDNKQAQNLAIEACAKVVKAFLDQQEDSGFNLTIDPSSLDVFSHSASATLVLNLKERNAWLLHLYSSFVKEFPRCHTQETRFVDGWTPHVSMGKFGTPNAARSKVFEIQKSGWLTDKALLPVKAVTLFKRDKADGKFYAISSVPLARNPGRLPRNLSGNEGWSSYFEGQSEALLQETERACQHVARKHGWTANLQTYGSHALQCGIAGISDIDAVVRLSGKSVDANKFFEELAARLWELHPAAKIRMRSARAGSSPLPILTARLFPSLPTLDLIACVLNSSGEPDGEASTIAFNTTKDTSALEQTFGGRSSDQCRVFRSVLRTVKVWAARVGIYSSSLGYLGGGGWAVIVHNLLAQGYLSGELPPRSNPHDALLFFLKKASKLDSLIFAPDSKALEAEKARTRGNMCVIASVSLGDYGRNSTPSTSRTTLEAMKSASEDSLKSAFCDDRTTEDRIQASHPFAIVATVKVQKSMKTSRGGEMAPAKGWMTAQLLSLMVFLEQQAPESNPRLYSNPSSTVPLSVTFYIGVNQRCHELEKLLQQWQAGIPDTPWQFDVSLVATADFNQR